jgi:hypothetical protein
MRTVTHKLWPVSYINDEGKQVDQLYTFNPARVDKSYWVGEPINVVAHHTESMTDTHKAEKIARLKAEIAKLEGSDVPA